MAGIYIHIPFCSTFCVYCGFFSVNDKNKSSRYVSALIQEIEERKEFFKGVLPDTIYIGGGTPSLLSICEYKRIFESIASNFYPEANMLEIVKEFTIEVNPDDITLEYAKGLRALGINRVSMGIQSFDDMALKKMNRRHSSAEAVESYQILIEAGFENISLDLIFGYSLASDKGFEDANLRWKRDVSSMIALRPEHISAYQLSIEPESILGRMCERGAKNIPLLLLSDDESSSQYSYLQGELEAAGYLQYEISNFSLEDRRAIHNSSYWDRISYIGLGPSAHSFYGDCRSWNTDNIEDYIAGEFLGDKEYLSKENIADEIIMVGLRKVNGLSLSSLDSYFVSSSLKLDNLISQGLLIKNGDTISIPKSKLFISDYIVSEIIKDIR